MTSIVVSDLQTAQRNSAALFGPGLSTPRSQRAIATFPGLGLIFVLFAEFVFLDVVRRFGLRAVRRLVVRTRVRNRPFSPNTVAAVTEAASYAATLYFRRVHCLQRSAAVTRVLRRRGVPARLVVGHQPYPIRGHAWVEVDGKIVTAPAKAQAHYIEIDAW